MATLGAHIAIGALYGGTIVLAYAAGFVAWVHRAVSWLLVVVAIGLSVAAQALT